MTSAAPLSRPSPPAGPRAVDWLARWLTPQRLRVYPAAILMAASLAWLANVLLGARLLDAAGTVIGADFLQFYTAGRFLLAGRQAELYDFNAQAEFQRQLLAPQSAPGLSSFVYPPFAAALSALFAWDGYLPGLVLWWGVGLLALAAALRLAAWELAPAGRPRLGRLLLASLMFFPTLSWFFNGQASALVLLIYAGSFVLLRRRRDFLAGLLLGLLLFKPQLGAGLAVMLLVRWRWRTLLGGALTGLALLALSLAISPAAMAAFLRLLPALPDLERSLLLNAWGLSSFFGFSVLLLDGFNPLAANLLAGLLTVLGALAIAAWWRRVEWRPGTRQWDLNFAASAALGLMISPHLFQYDLMLLLLPLLIAWSHYPNGTAGRALDGGPLLAWTGLLYLATFAGGYLSAAQQWASAALGLPEMAFQVVTPIVAVWAGLLARLARRGD